MAALRATIGGTAPHPVATEANRAVRERIAAYLRRLGYDVRIQKAFACSPNATCAAVENIIAARPGRGSGPVVLAVAHYDSVPAGPGVSDDGVGVAALLEIARILRSERLRNRVVFLIDDGEEAGLLGAEAFVADRNLSRDVAAVVNLEARGSRGPSFLFETSAKNGWIAPLVARALPRPVTTSLFAMIYDRLPNDTDLTVFKRAGFQGVNFAYIGNVNAYHTPNDDLEHADRRSVQHHGENALAAIRTLANAQPRIGEENAVWFDVLAWFVITWPERWSLLLAGAALLLTIATAAVAIRRRSATTGGVAAGSVIVLSAIVAAPLIAFIASWLGHLRAGGRSWIAHPQPLLVAAWVAGIAVPLVAASLLRREFEMPELQRGVAVTWSVLAVAVSLVAPSSSFLFVIPALALLLPPGAAAATAAVVAALYFPLALFLYDALGRAGLVAVALLVAMTASTFAAAVRIGRRAMTAAAVSMILCVAVAIALPATTRRQPRAISLSYFDDGEAPAWTATALTPRLASSAEFRQRRTIAPWMLRPGAVSTAPAPNLRLPAPELRVVSNERDAVSRRVRLAIRSRRRADRVLVALHSASEVISLRIDGTPPSPRVRRYGRPFARNWHRVVVRGSEAEIEIVTRGGSPIEVVFADYSYGLPAAGRGLAGARDASDAVASDDGDMTIVMRRTAL